MNLIQLPNSTVMFICLCTCRYTMSKLWQKFRLCVEPSLWPWWSLHDATISKQFHHSLLSGKCLIRLEKIVECFDIIIIHILLIFLPFYFNIFIRNRIAFSWRLSLKAQKSFVVTMHNAWTQIWEYNLTYEFGFLFSENLLNVLLNRKWMVYYQFA